MVKAMLMIESRFILVRVVECISYCVNHCRRKSSHNTQYEIDGLVTVIWCNLLSLWPNGDTEFLWFGIIRPGILLSE